VADRIRRLEAAGVITGYHAAVNPAKLGLGLTVIIRFKSSRAPDERIFPVILGCPEIIEFHSVTGDDCMTLTAVVSSVEHLQDLIGRLTPYGASHTSIVLSSPLRHRAIGPAALGRESERDVEKERSA
jgi:Lrp/AsnC family leucine-responsive transcriptional regulator